MKLLVITQPAMFAGEAEAIDALFRCGLDGLHLRKPSASAADVERLFAAIPQEWHGRIMLHDWASLPRLTRPGLHLNARCPEAPAGYQGRLSAACHTLDEVAQRKAAVDYVFLSPIFDSISKQGYRAAFRREELEAARDAGVIDRRVIALGGITQERIPEVRALGFGGVALLGDVWSRVGDRRDFLDHFEQLRDAARP